MKIKPNKPVVQGFTLIELMIVVAIIGILAVVAVPKFADLITKSKESTAKNAIGALRSAISIYYSDTTVYPGDVTVALTAGQKYFKAIPVLDIPASASQGNPGHLGVTGVKNVAAPDDDVANGVFAYVLAGDQGDIYINCLHNDSKSRVWSSY